MLIVMLLAAFVVALSLLLCLGLFLGRSRG